MMHAQFKQYAMSNVPHIYFKTMEHDRAAAIAVQGCKEVGIENVFRFSGVSGLRRIGGKGGVCDNIISLKELLAFAKEQVEKTCIIIQDIHHFYDDRHDMSVLSEMIDYASKPTPIMVTGLSALSIIPDELLLRTYMIELPLPSRTEIEAVVLERTGELGIHLSTGIRKLMINALNGLSEEEIGVLINRVISDAFAAGKHIGIASVNLINDQKKQVIQKSGLVEFMNANVRLDDVGGLYRLKRWLKDRKPIFDDMEAAATFGLKPPKGILMFGAPGAGKSLTAKVIANYYALPLLRVDMGLIFGHKSPEEAITRVCKLADTIAPCVLFIDELEKALAGSESGSADPVAVKMLGALLTWMQERTEPVFLVATANDISMIRPETYRDGRVDEKFFLGFLEDVEQVEQIIDIHLRIRIGKDVETIVRPLDYGLILKKMDQKVTYYGGKEKAGYSGANMEALVIKVLENRFFRNKDTIDTKDFLHALNTLKPQHGFNIAQMMQRAREMDAITA